MQFLLIIVEQKIIIMIQHSSVHVCENMTTVVAKTVLCLNLLIPSSAFAENNSERKEP